MPLATKNNAIIVTGGKVAENCNCCGGWTCYEPACDRFACATVTVTVQSSQRLERIIWEQYAGQPCQGKSLPYRWSTSGLFPGNLFSGTFTLLQRGPSAWRYEYPASGNLCSGSYVDVVCNANTPNIGIELSTQMQGLLITDRRGVNSYSASDFSCQFVNLTASPFGLCDIFTKGPSGGITAEIRAPDNPSISPGQTQFVFTAQARVPFAVGAAEQDRIVEGTFLQYEPVVFTVNFEL